MSDAAVQATGKKDGTLSDSARDQLNTVARKFADELVNSDYSYSKFLPDHLRKYESDNHLNSASRDHLARQVAADNYADRLNAEQDARLHPSNNQLEQQKIIPKVILGMTEGHPEISGVDNAPYEHPKPVETPAPQKATPSRKDTGDYPNTIPGIEWLWNDFFGPKK